MADLKEKGAVLFARNSQNPNFEEKFEKIEADRDAANFNQKFFVSPLSQEEDNIIQNLLYTNSIPNKTDDHEVEVDYKTLSDITKQIRAIDGQGALLHGERIQKARELLKKYRDGTFTEWLKVAYGNRQTPYRLLHFYELFQRLEKEDRPLLERMPKKSAYSLAMREGDISKKIEIIRGHYKETPSDIAAVIEASFPLVATDRRKRKSHDETIIGSLEEGIKKLACRKSVLSESTRERLEELARQIKEIKKKNKEDLEKEKM